MTELKTRGGAAGLFKFGIAAFAAAALTFAGMAPANALQIQLGPDAIAGFEDGDAESDFFNYDQWHIGNNDNPDQFDLLSTDSLTFNACSITGKAPVERDITQVLLGFAADERPSTVADIRAMIESMSVNMVSGSVTLQMPFFVTTDEGRQFFTARNVDGFSTAGTHSLSADTTMIAAGQEGEISLEDLLAEMEAGEADGILFELLGLGFTLTEGTEVRSFSFGGDEYLFGTGDCLTPAPIDPAAPIKPKAPVAVETGI